MLLLQILLQHSHLTTIIYIPYESYKCNHYIRLSVHCHNGKMYTIAVVFYYKKKISKIVFFTRDNLVLRWFCCITIKKAFLMENINTTALVLTAIVGW